MLWSRKHVFDEITWSYSMKGGQVLRRLSLLSVDSNEFFDCVMSLGTCTPEHAIRMMLERRHERG
jgi:hypothetical protein